MGLTVDIGKMVRAREWLWGGVVIVLLIAWIEIILTIAVAVELEARSLVFLVLAVAVLIAQFRILGITRSTFARVIRELWRAYAFIVLALVFFLSASVALADAILPLYFALLSIVLAYPSLKVMHGLRTVRNELCAVTDPTMLMEWLEGSRSTLTKLRVRQPRLRQALPWFALAACSLLTLSTLIVMHELKVIRSGVPVLPLVLLGAYFLNRGRRHIKLRAAELRQVDPRAPVLILRSFKDDKFPIEGRIYRRLTVALRPTLEEQVAYEAESLGPPILIGEPREKLPPLGASREYLRSGDWRTAVSSLIDEAALIIFILGDTDNLFWEFSTTIGKRGKDALLVVVPPLRKQSDLELRWRRFVEANAELLGASFPRHLPHEFTVAFFFRQDEPVLVVSQKRGWWDYALGIRLFIRLYQTQLSSLRDVRRHLSAQVPGVVG